MSVPLPLLAELDEPSDAELIDSVRSGDNDAYGLLYRRHAGSAVALARQLAGSAAEADDLVAEAFAKVLVTLRAGGGPDAAFRAYLLTTLRNTLYDRARRDRRVELSDDMTRHDPGVPWEDTAVARLESSLAARAFNRLPERWQTVLWHTEVEQESPAQLAPLLGLTPNGVAALAYRAREGLRQAYLQEHLADGVDVPHRATVNRLGAWARGGLSPRQRAQVDGHLASCTQCRILAAELQDVNGRLRAIVAPLVLGSGAAAYLATHAGGGAGTAAGAVAEATTAGSMAAGSATTGAAAAGTAAVGSTAPAAGGTAVAAGAISGSTAAGTAAGTAAAGTAAAGTAGAVGTAAAGLAGTGSVIGTVTAWVAGTSAGQVVAATAATAAAVVIGGATIVATSEGASPAVPPVAAAIRNPGLPGSDGQAPGATPGAAPGVGGPAGAPRGSAEPSAGTGRGGNDSEASRRAGPGRRGAPGRAAPADRGPAGGDPTAPGGSAGPSALPVPGTAQLAATAPYPVAPMRRGAPGQVAVPVRNSGGGPASTVVATVVLPAGFSLRAGSGSNGWQCTGAGTTVTCTLPTLAGGAGSILRILVTVGAHAELAGTVSGELDSDDGAVAGTIPATVLDIQP